MNTRAKQFVFESYELNKDSKLLQLHYSVDGAYHFIEEWIFDFDWSDDVDAEALDRALFLLHILAGVSYYKAHLAEEIIVQSGQLDAQSADMFAQIYQKGLGQFFYTNQLDPKLVIPFISTAEQLDNPIELKYLSGNLLPIGGGKDSLVAAEILIQSKNKFTSWVINHSTRFESMLHKFEMPHVGVKRQVDRRIAELNREGAYNGHIPITAIVSAAAVVSALLLGKKSVILSNEAAASEGNVAYRGVEVNHQYSKSIEFEKLLSNYINRVISPDIAYFSLLRPLTELAIAERLSRVFDKYEASFSSCNDNFHLGDTEKLHWCGHCSKCAFVFLILTPFMPKQKIMAIFGGENLFEKPSLHDTYLELFGLKDFKPFECVGETEECRFAAQLALKSGQYPELERFNIPAVESFDYKALRPSLLSEAWLEIIRKTS